MTRHALVASLLVLILGACKSSGEPAAGKPASGDDPSAAQPGEAKPAETPPGEAKPGEAPGEAAAPSAEPGAADAGPATAAADTAASDSASLQPTALVGQFGFNWLQPDPEKAKCVKLDDRLARKLAAQKAKCRRRPAGESFDGQAGGDWASCRAGRVEWLLYATKEICQVELETMQANAP
jgi:hypothetical protein